MIHQLRKHLLQFHIKTDARFVLIWPHVKISSRQKTATFFITKCCTGYCYRLITHRHSTPTVGTSLSNNQRFIISYLGQNLHPVYHRFAARCKFKPGLLLRFIPQKSALYRQQSSIHPIVRYEQGRSIKKLTTKAIASDRKSVLTTLHQ